MDFLYVLIWSSFILLVLGGGLLLFFLSKFYHAQPQVLPYVAVPLLTDTECRFFQVLQDSLPRDCYLLAQVRLANLVHVKPGSGTSFWKNFSPIGMKCVDFVIVRHDTMKPILVIELDDRTHARTERRQRDHFVDQVLAAVAIPVLHWPASASYNSTELSQAISSKLSSRAKTRSAL
ncbi:hypothetical protein SE17_08295 [Kouleothrix aurantiaca]|jgi:very-short-patch-repair endonuclease|uniref:DUF2726 domain-containing protein n=1 Tax=Kouleothrix aurantiaca TaxID=186479 RepID=A0A0P9D757_9CHLR|nr:hypothetical protein SE17_08295 [Kouleothrix aurantiaca]